MTSDTKGADNMTYVDRDYYSSLYINIPDDFEALNVRACHKLDRATAFRSEQFEMQYDEDTATDFERRKHRQIKDTVCELINIFDSEKKRGADSGIVSASNDGLSVSYAVVSREQAEKDLFGVMQRGLCGTGLMGAL